MYCGDLIGLDIFDMPVDVVGEAVEYQCQLIVMIALGLVVAVDILAEHEAVGYLAVADTLGVVAHVVALDLDIGAGGDIVLIVLLAGLPAVGIRHLRVVARLVLPLQRPLLVLHVLEEEERCGILLAVVGAAARGIGSVRQIDASAQAVCGVGLVLPHLALGDKLLGRRRIFLSQIALRRYIPDLHRVDIDSHVIFESGGIVGHRQLRHAAAYPRLHGRGCAVYDDRWRLEGRLVATAEEAEHLAVVGYRLVPRQTYRLQAVDRLYGLGILLLSRQIAHVGRNIYAVAAVCDLHAERRTRRRPLSDAAAGTLLLAERIAALALLQIAGLDELVVVIVEQHA